MVTTTDGMDKRIRDLLTEVAALDPGSHTADETPVCFFCEVDTVGYTGRPETQHADDCLWARIRRVLDMDVPPAAAAGPVWPDEDGDDA